MMGIGTHPNFMEYDFGVGARAHQEYALARIRLLVNGHADRYAMTYRT